MKHNVWFGWNVKNFAQKLLIGPGLTRRGGVDRHSTWKLSFLRWGLGEGGSIDTQLGSCHFLGGEGGEGGEGGSIDTQLGSCHFLGGEGGRGGGGGVDQHSTWKLSFLRWGGRGGRGGGGGRSTLNLERIRKDFGRIASDNADPGGGRSTLNLERIRKDLGRIAST